MWREPSDQTDRRAASHPDARPLAPGPASAHNQPMRNVVRWTVFTFAVVVVGLGGAFLMLYFGRLYGSADPALIFAALVTFCAGVTVASISFASKLEDEERLRAERRAAASRAVDPEF